MSSINPLARWDFTLSAVCTTDEDLLKTVKKFCKQWSFQLEGSETGYLHYQGRVSFKTKTRKPTGFPKETHWSPTAEINAGNDFYVTKEETRIRGPWTDLDEEKTKCWDLEGKVPWPWQQHVIDDAKVFDDRTINMIIDKQGHNGKKFLTKYMAYNELGSYLPCLDSYKDLMAIVLDKPISRLYIVDAPRQWDPRTQTQFWMAIENIKDGYCFDTRFKYRERIFGCPQVWVMSNRSPDQSALTKDRWRLWTIDSETHTLHPYQQSANDSRGASL